MISPDPWSDQRRASPQGLPGKPRIAFANRSPDGCLVDLAGRNARSGPSQPLSVGKTTLPTGMANKCADFRGL